MNVTFADVPKRFPANPGIAVPFSISGQAGQECNS